MPPPDIAQLPPAFAGAALDRVSLLRTDERWVAERWHDPESRALGVGEDGILVADSAESLAPARLDPRALALHTTGEPVLLGLEDGRALFAVDLRGVDTTTLEELAPTRACSRCATPARCSPSPTEALRPTPQPCSTGTAALRTAASAAPLPASRRPAICVAALGAERPITRAPTRW
ncbi:MAG: hypothetical protein AVDCRST_MAG45-18 [uncultured Solirubrobacterales bacterium]|uniref:Uncharacterized protein n=1 Tax=uncultured Solirubrobacterales bacterium TaxID=768556 RepID=A0A6J4RW74_9ACTN|nr:MAG: hypothetical protein AVDCRST_MAG45-18 [uncultured Solirubrobacterales bacterium]